MTKINSNEQIQKLDQEIIKINMNIEKVFFDYCEKMDDLVNLNSADKETEKIYINALKKELKCLNERLVKVNELLEKTYKIKNK